MKHENYGLEVERIRRSHQPKGGQCANCLKWPLDCSNMDFESMPVIAKDGDVNIVKCLQFRREFRKDRLERRHNFYKEGEYSPKKYDNKSLPDGGSMIDLSLKMDSKGLFGDGWEGY